MCFQPNSTQLPARTKGSEAENPTNPGENRTWKQQPDTHLWAVFILIGKCRWVQGRAGLAMELFPGFRDLEQPGLTLGTDPDTTKYKFGDWGSDFITALQWVRLERSGCSRGGVVPTAQDLSGKLGDLWMSR